MNGNDPQHSFGFLLSDVSRLLKRNFNRRVRPLGLTESQWRALARLSRQEGVNQATLADLLDIRPITLTQAIGRMSSSSSWWSGDPTRPTGGPIGSS